MPHVQQPESALARVETYILAAKRALEAGQLRLAEQQMALALGAVTFAANTQTRLITSLNAIVDDTRCLLTHDREREALDAVTQAESSGID